MPPAEAFLTSPYTNPHHVVHCLTSIPSSHRFSLNTHTLLINRNYFIIRHSTPATASLQAPYCKPPRTRLSPAPRPAIPHRHQALPHLPPTFGQNQLLSVPNSTRALLESIAADFDAPIRYAFAYGSGVFEQDGYQSEKGAPMLDFIFAVTHPAHFHSINMSQHPSHYAMYARTLGSSFVTRVQEVGPGVWFNAFVKAKGRVCVIFIIVGCSRSKLPSHQTIKYGVTSVDNLCSDLLNWNSLYLAGRMHKPLRIIKDDARVRLTQQVNLTSAVRAALLTLPAEFSEKQLFETIAGISYSGDPRMVLPGENRGKVGNIVRKQGPQFRELYSRLVTGLPGVHWPTDSSAIQQDTSPLARVAHLKKLPPTLLSRVRGRYASDSSIPAFESDEVVYWKRIAGDEQLPSVLRNRE
jgi:translocator assembly and maintenance protein 41